MSDECTCEKCQSVSVVERGASVWPVLKAELQTGAYGRRQANLYLVVTDAGISLRRQPFEM